MPPPLDFKIECPLLWIPPGSARHGAGYMLVKVSLKAMARGPT